MGGVAKNPPRDMDVEKGSVSGRGVPTDGAPGIRARGLLSWGGTVPLKSNGTSVAGRLLARGAPSVAGGWPFVVAHHVAEGGGFPLEFRGRARLLGPNPDRSVAVCGTLILGGGPKDSPSEESGSV